MATVAHLSAIQARVPFLHFFDGFRTSHEISKVHLISYDDLANIVDWQAIKEFKERGFRPEKPEMRGTAQNPQLSRLISHSPYRPRMSPCTVSVWEIWSLPKYSIGRRMLR